MARVLEHPHGGQKFTSTVDPVSWPADQFTFRRIADGSIVRADAKPSIAASTVAPPKMT